MTYSPQEVLEFWFTEIDSASWWKKDLDFDAQIQHRFSKIHQEACLGRLADWRETAKGRLAEIIVLDQFSRNMYRDMAEAFLWDGFALLLSQEAVRVGADNDLSPTERAFLYMPMMHSELLSVHEAAVKLFDQPGLENNYDFELKHKAIIDRFGRYPHRNEILGRVSTPDELSFLKEPGSSF